VSAPLWSSKIGWERRFLEAADLLPFCRFTTGAYSLRRRLHRIAQFGPTGSPRAMTARPFWICRG